MQKWTDKILEVRFMNSKEGLYTLEAKEIYLEAKRLYQDFFAEQTPLKAFKLSIILYHLLEWIVPNSNKKKYLKQLKNRCSRENLSLSSKEQFVLELRSYEFYEVLRSIADNSKHFRLDESSAYDKTVVEGFRAGQSVAGERVGQANLAVIFDSRKVWLREVFAYVLGQYSDYFNDCTGIYCSSVSQIPR